jgi:hypothetical protein
MLSASSLFTFVVSSLLLFPVLTAAAPAADFAALTVIPYGRQSYDIATGLTVLADGGEVQDRERGISLAGCGRASLSSSSRPGPEATLVATSAAA